MKDYSQEVFLSLDPNRQIKVSLDLVSRIESVWEEETLREKLIDKLKFHLSWMTYSKDFKKLKPKELLKSLEGEVTLRKILNVATAFERKLNVSSKDEQMLVKSEDTTETKGRIQPLYLILDNLRSAHNVGSIFRTADCFGVKHIYLVGYTATPEDPSVKKTAMGTDDFVSWSHVEKLNDLLDQLKNKGVRVVALETADGAELLSEASVKKESALLLGNERFGLEPKHLEQADQILEIPMLGRKNSLNVSNACSVAIYTIVNSWSKASEQK